MVVASFSAVVAIIKIANEMRRKAMIVKLARFGFGIKIQRAIKWRIRLGVGSMKALS